MTEKGLVQYIFSYSRTVFTLKQFLSAARLLDALYRRLGSLAGFLVTFKNKAKEGYIYVIPVMS